MFGLVDKSKAAPAGSVTPGRSVVRTPGYLPPRSEQLSILLARGWSMKRCATEMKITENTVRVMASEIYFRLGIAGRDELIRARMSGQFAEWASRWGGLIPTDAIRELGEIFGNSGQGAERWLD